LVTKTNFENKTVPAYGYFLISRDSLDGSDIILDNLTLTESNTIQIKNQNGDVVDKIGWGQASDCEGICAAEPPSGQSIQRKFQNNTFIDTDNNAQDFEIQTCPSPKTKNCQQANQAPRAFFVYAPSNPQVGDLITFNAASSSDPDPNGSVVSYQWDFGDNTTSTVSIATTTHTYSQAGNYSVGLIVFDEQNASSSVTSTIIFVQSAGVNHIVISEIMASAGYGHSNEEFIELHNLTDQNINLTGYFLKRINSFSSTSTENLLADFSTSTIAAKSFFLIASTEYSNASTTPDLRYNRSYHLADDEDIVILENNLGEEINRVVYSSIDAGKSLERKAFSGGNCVSAQGNGKFLGNACNTDNTTDFEIRDIPNPQNSLSFPEPRNAPTTPQNFALQYSSSTMELIFNWSSSQDYSGATSTITYKITDISNASSTLSTIETASTTAKTSINEVGRVDREDYRFSIQAFDGDGLGSATNTASITVPSFLSGLYFYQDPRAPSTNYLIEAYYNQYPFVPDLFNQNKWQLVVFYLNSEADKQMNIEMSPGPVWQPNDLTNVLKIKYKQCAGGTQANSLLIPLSSGYCGTSGGAYNQALNFSELEPGDNHFIIQTASSSQDLNLTGNNFITVAFYTTYSTQTMDGRVPSFQLVAVDKTKYYFGQEPTRQLPQLSGEITLNFDKQSSRLNISWPRATDSDTLDSLLTYEIRYTDSDNWQSVNATGTIKIVNPGDNFSINVRAKDDFGNYSSPAMEAQWSYPETQFFITQSDGSAWGERFGYRGGDGSPAIALQSIVPQSDFQFNKVVLKIRRVINAGADASLKLSVAPNGSDNRPNLSATISSAYISPIFALDGSQDTTFTFSSPVPLITSNTYWLVSEVGGYGGNAYEQWQSNRWENAVSNSNPYPFGETARIYGGFASYPNVDWYMKIGLEQQP